MKKSALLLTTLIGVLASATAMAQDGGITGAYSSLAIAVGLIMAFASSIGTFSQSRAAVAALEGIARNPQAADKIQTPLIISLALIESLVILGFVIAFLLQSKIV